MALPLDDDLPPLVAGGLLCAAWAWGEDHVILCRIVSFSLLMNLAFLLAFKTIFGNG